MGFRVLKAFLSSPNSVETLGGATVRMMCNEVDEAQAREAYLMDLVRLLQVHHESHPSPAPRSREQSPSTLSGAVSFERLPVTGSPLAERPSQRNIWTLWSFVQSALRRQDFASEVDAWAA